MSNETLNTCVHGGGPICLECFAQCEHIKDCLTKLPHDLVHGIVSFGSSILAGAHAPETPVLCAPCLAPSPTIDVATGAAVVTSAQAVVAQAAGQPSGTGATTAHAFLPASVSTTLSTPTTTGRTPRQSSSAKAAGAAMAIKGATGKATKAKGAIKKRPPAGPGFSDNRCGNRKHANYKEEPTWGMPVFIDANGIAAWNMGPGVTKKVDLLKHDIDTNAFPTTTDGPLHPVLGVTSIDPGKAGYTRIALEMFGGTVKNVNPGTVGHTEKCLENLRKFLSELGMMVKKGAGDRTPDDFRARFFCVETWNKKGYRLVPGGKKTGGQGRPSIVYVPM